MEGLDLILLDAWNRVSARLKKDRIEALKRSQRRFTKSFARPMRDWCLVIRASDTRINKDGGAVLNDEAVAAHDPHEVTLPGFLIRNLTKPVHINWPGVTYHEAARLLGREYPTLYTWVREGVFKINRYRKHGFPENGKPPGPNPKNGRQRVNQPPGPMPGPARHSS